ncbi:hypothetical protein [Psychroserpens sp. MEBiC05023]
MIIRKEIKDDNELYLWFNGKLIYKRWLNQGYSKVFDHFAWGKYTDQSITDFDLEKTPPLIHIKTYIELISAENGGRKNGISSGYRPNHVFEYQTDGRFEFSYVGDIQIENDKILEPGEKGIVTVRFLTHQPNEKHLNIGRKWFIHEGPNLVAKAEILGIKFPKTD